MLRLEQDAKVRTRRPANRDHAAYTTNYDNKLLDLKDTALLYQMTLLGLKDKKSDYLKIQSQYLNKEITREEAVKKLVDGGILNATRAKGQPSFWDDLKS